MRINGMEGWGGFLPLWAPEDEGGSGGGDGGAPEGEGGGTPAPESVLFPSEGNGDKPADPPAGGNEGDSEWKEYEPDPNKSDEENAAAKAEHDAKKPADKDDGDNGDNGDNDDNADKVPEDGKYDLKMPEGMEADTELAEALGPEFKELGLTNGQAQKLVDKYIEIQQRRAEEHAKSPEGAWSMSAYGYFKEHGTPDTWADTAKADKEIGGDNWNTSVANARRAVEKIGTPELKKYLNSSGGGNHPELIRFMAKAGAMIREDNPANGGAEGAGKPVEAAHALFPTDAPKG